MEKDCIIVKKKEYDKMLKDLNSNRLRINMTLCINNDGFRTDVNNETCIYLSEGIRSQINQISELLIQKVHSHLKDELENYKDARKETRSILNKIREDHPLRKRFVDKIAEKFGFGFSVLHGSY